VAGFSFWIFLSMSSFSLFRFDGRALRPIGRAFCEAHEDENKMCNFKGKKKLCGGFVRLLILPSLFWCTSGPLLSSPYCDLGWCVCTWGKKRVVCIFDRLFFSSIDHKHTASVSLLIGQNGNQDPFLSSPVPLHENTIIPLSLI
jgi:hypothetical protein